MMALGGGGGAGGPLAGPKGGRRPASLSADLVTFFVAPDRRLLAELGAVGGGELGQQVLAVAQVESSLKASFADGGEMLLA